jgi:3-hydroxymyristoyl/3-hydroxydecanoyl-(acyl carrier protein) dehydratase
MTAVMNVKEMLWQQPGHFEGRGCQPVVHVAKVQLEME